MAMNSIKDLKITTLAENLVMTKCLGQWGLSFLLEFIDTRGRRRKVMFDTGLHKKPLMHNVKQLKINLDDLDCLVISHGHSDHTAATVEVVKSTGGVRVHAHPHTFQPRFHIDKLGKRRRKGVAKNEGLEAIEKVGGEVLLNAEPTEILQGIWTTGQIQRVTQFEQPLPLREGEKRIIVVDGEEIDDVVLDDQALWMDVETLGPFVITGCAHAGPLNTIMQVQKLGNFQKIGGLVGGTHLIDRSEGYLHLTIDGLEQFGLSLVSPCHCTGFKATTRIWQAFPKEFLLNFTGRVIEAGKEPENRLI
jgi:7,8-dihydropterin-6-yl-methyl-4-(beta-D-ribofuranosyl)aminobenzene 5'-phosphate synthase